MTVEHFHAKTGCNRARDSYFVAKRSFEARRCDGCKHLKLPVRGHFWPRADPRYFKPVRWPLKAEVVETGPYTAFWQIVRCAEQPALRAPVASGASDCLAPARGREENGEGDRKQGASPRRRDHRRERSADPIGPKL